MFISALTNSAVLFAVFAAGAADGLFIADWNPQHAAGQPG